jgi:hypothetical protein
VCDNSNISNILHILPLISGAKILQSALTAKQTLYFLRKMLDIKKIILIFATA